jgi:hypothetical protein
LSRLGAATEARPAWIGTDPPRPWATDEFCVAARSDTSRAENWPEEEKMSDLKGFRKVVSPTRTGKAEDGPRIDAILGHAHRGEEAAR